jgi:hypothetical protein
MFHLLGHYLQGSSLAKIVIALVLIVVLFMLRQSFSGPRELCERHKKEKRPVANDGVLYIPGQENPLVRRTHQMQCRECEREKTKSDLSTLPMG